LLLADEPNNRSMCAVTLFLSLANADGVLSALTCTENFASLHLDDGTGWVPVVLPYKLGSGPLPVQRRTGAGNRSKAMSSCAM
jgi:hypothetical protein